MSSLSPDEVDRYLARIGLSGPLPPTARTLATIQHAHLRAVPFENLDICYLGQPLSLETSALYDKIVSRNRGGFCFELNGLLATLLESLGFDVERRGGWFADEAAPDPFDHLVLEVMVPGDGSRWYVDGGAGRANPDRPIPIEGASADGQWRSRLVDGERLAEQAWDDGRWQPVLRWGSEAHPLDAFAARCRYFVEDPGSFFRQGSLVSILVDGGRRTVAKRTLITTFGGVREEQPLDSNADIQAVLQSIFGIDLAIDDRWR